MKTQTSDHNNSVDNRIYTEEQVAFLKACDAYRTKKLLKFMRAVDYLAVVREMGYALQSH